MALTTLFARRLAAASAALLCAQMCPGQSAEAKVKAGELAEMYGAPFSVAVDPRMKVERVAPDDPTAVAFGPLLPMGTEQLEVVRVYWPKSKQWCALAIGLPGPGGTVFEEKLAAELARTPPFFGVMLEGQTPQRVDVAGLEGAGAMSRLCAWPTGPDLGELVILLSLVAQGDDSIISGVAVDLDGTLRPVQTGSARTLYGWFDLTDINEDGSYELITRRSLDGVPGGFFYRAVRSYDQELQSYFPRPDAYHSFFESELAWLEWLIETQGRIKASPGDFESRESSGPRYLAEFDGQVYAFDSVIDAVAAPSGGESSAAKAMESIRKYRTELDAWLNGGAIPSIWKLGAAP
jgi:hypothetical protein